LHYQNLVNLNQFNLWENDSITIEKNHNNM